MGSRKGMRAQEQQAREDRELSGASAGYREPDSAGRRSIETPSTPSSTDPDTRSAIGSGPSHDTDDVQQFEDNREQIDDENDLA